MENERPITTVPNRYWGGKQAEHRGLPGSQSHGLRRSGISLLGLFQLCERILSGSGPGEALGWAGSSTHFFAIHYPRLAVSQITYNSSRITPLHLQTKVHKTSCFGPLSFSSQLKDGTFFMLCKSAKLKLIHQTCATSVGGQTNRY